MARPVTVAAPVDWHRERREAPRGILIHSMGEHITLESGDVPAGDFLAQAPTLAGSKLSAHRLISPGGTVLRCVDVGRVAYHAGVSRWRGHEIERSGRPSLNDRFLGIEVLASGAWDYAAFRQATRSGLIEFTESQYESAGWQVARWMAVHDIDRVDVRGHSEVAGDEVRGAGRGKVDPGPGFVWPRLWSAVDSWRERFKEELNYES